MDRVAGIHERLSQALESAEIEIIDESHLHAGHAGAASGAGHFNVSIVSSSFNDKSLIERHRLVYSAVDDMMKTEIHALSIDAKTPSEAN